MRLRINGPKDISKFNAGKYAKEWVKSHMETDNPLQVRRSKRPRTDRSDYDDEAPDDDTVLQQENMEQNVYFTDSQLF